jgi:polyisoprenoid-binding protein YceI
VELRFAQSGSVKITFVSTSVKQEGDSALVVDGNLTIKDVTKPLTINFDYTGSATDPFLVTKDPRSESHR